MLRKFTLCLLALMVGNIVSLPARSQGDDCRLSPEDCAILEAHAATLLQLDNLAIKNFVLAGSIDLLNPVEFSAIGAGIIQLEDLSQSRVVLQISDTNASEEARLETLEIIERRLGDLGYGDIEVELVADEISIQAIGLHQWQEELAEILTTSENAFLEFVDFADIPMTISDGMCIQTDAQLEQGNQAGECADGNQPIGTDGQVGGPPFHTVLTGDSLDDVTAAASDFDQWIIWFKFDDEGAQIFEDYTAAHVGQRLAIVIDGVIISAPTIQQAIPGGVGQITGDFTQAEAEELATRLRVQDSLPLELSLTSIEVGDAYATVPAEINVEVNSLTVATEDAEFSQTDVDGFVLDAAQSKVIFAALTLVENNLNREADADFESEPVAVFSSEVPLNAVFESDGAGGLLADFFLRVLSPEGDFDELGITPELLQEFFTENLRGLPNDITLSITRYISLDDSSLVRLTLATDFELPLGVLIQTLELPEGSIALTAFHLELRADFE